MTCLALSLEIQDRFLNSDYYQGADCLALYSAVSNEVLTEEVALQAISCGKQVVYPRVSGAGLEFVAIQDLAELVAGTFGVLEPQGGRLVDVAAIDVLLVPGVAFDRDGHRLGYGKGYYDRTLAECPASSVHIGLAYDFQLIDALPVGEHDRPVSVLMTESCTLRF